jgi:hypothetical protein
MPLEKSRNSLEQRYLFAIQISISLSTFIFILIHNASDHHLGAVIMQDNSKTAYSLLFARAQYSLKAVYNH